jgi:hypothetical protein
MIQIRLTSKFIQEIWWADLLQECVANVYLLAVS